MRTTLILLAILAPAIQAVAQCDGTRYFNQVFPEFTEVENLVYGENVNVDGDNEELLLDVYTPIGDTEAERPLIIMVHGGSFIGGSKDQEDVVPLAEDFVKMGYVVASMNYRLGIPIDPFNLEQLAQNAVVRGYHDAKAAVRWFRKDVAENGNTYGIDQDRIYMAGVSAGGFVALHNAYLDEESEIPAEVDLDLPGMGGGVEGESGNPGYSSEVAGIVNIAGAIKDTTYMEAGDVPVLNFHGTGDTVVPFDSDMLQFFGAVNVTEVDGSAAITAKADEVGILNCFEIYEMQGHVPHVGNEAYYDTTRSIMANFIGHLACPQYDLDCSYREIELDVAEQSSLFNLRVFPNPATTEVIVETPGAEKGELRVTSIDGRTVMQMQTQQSPVLRIAVNQWPAGTYIFSFQTDRGVRSRRVLIQ